MRLLLPAVLVASALMLSACDSGSDATDPPPASFEATVSGDRSLRFEGPASLYGSAIVDPNAPGDTLATVYSLVLSGFDHPDRPGIFFRLAEAPAVGTVVLDDALGGIRGTGVSLFIGRDADAVFAPAVSGRLTITRADGEGVAGSFRFVTEESWGGLLGGPPVPLPEGPAGEAVPFEVTVEGTFDAARLAGPTPVGVPGGPRPLPGAP